jgi:hypothetical protein
MVELSKLAKLSKGKGAPPPASHSEDNLTKPPSRQKVPLQLKISPELRREFKGYAIERDSEVSELFIRVWEFYKANHG